MKLRKDEAQVNHGLIVDANACEHAEEEESPMIVADHVPIYPLPGEIGIRTFDDTKGGAKDFEVLK